MYCINCGKELIPNSKFCNNCGNPVNNVIEREEVKTEDASERKIEYEGKVYKCPNCGEVLNSFVINCPACGHELRDSRRCESIEELSRKLEEIENNRENSGLAGLLDIVTKTDLQKISLIRNFPIPNNKEDLYEFLILSSSNVEHISVFSYERRINARREISNAWKAKFEQAYQKAKLLFKDDTVMVEINQMHEQVKKR